MNLKQNEQEALSENLKHPILYIKKKKKNEVRGGGELKICQEVVDGWMDENKRAV